jgi:cell cycle protein kinase DBF2
MPPGAYDLPNVFDNAMKLAPTAAGSGSPSKKTNVQTRSGIHVAEDNVGTIALDSSSINSGSPARRSNKENTPPTTGRPGLKKESSYITQAAASRQEIYKTREAEVPRPGYQSQRGLTAHELEILQKPSLKRLTGVTQLCK